MHCISVNRRPALKYLFIGFDVLIFLLLALALDAVAANGNCTNKSATNYQTAAFMLTCIHNSSQQSEAHRNRTDTLLRIPTAQVKKPVYKRGTNQTSVPLGKSKQKQANPRTRIASKTPNPKQRSANSTTEQSHHNSSSGRDVFWKGSESAVSQRSNQGSSNGSRTNNSRAVPHRKTTDLPFHQVRESSSGKATHGHPEVHYRPTQGKHSVIETKRQRKRRMAKEAPTQGTASNMTETNGRNITPLDSKNFTDIANNCSGHYRMRENITLSHKQNRKLPLCPKGFTGSLTSDEYWLSGVNASTPGGDAGLFYSLDHADVDLNLEKPHAAGRTAGAVAARLGSGNRVQIRTEGRGEVYGEDFSGTVAGRVIGSNNQVTQNGGVDVRGARAGGGVGSATGTSFTLAQSEMDAGVSIEGEYAAGGIAITDGLSKMNLTQSHVNPTIKGEQATGGGVALQ